MVRSIFAFIVLLHGLIHFMGFAKAFHYGTITQLTKDISRPVGILWLITALLFVVAAVLIFIKKEGWWMIGLVAVISSQILISMDWRDAKFGTIANVVILIGVVLIYGRGHFENQYKKDVTNSLHRTSTIENTLVTEADLQPLPPLVQQYLKYAGVLNKPKVKNVKVVFEGVMRDKGKDWFPIVAEQHDFFDIPTRLFFMKAKMFGITIPGYHAYNNGTATMQIKFYGLLPIVNEKGNELNKAETVTIFNDMCLLAPATLIDKRIQWESVNDSSVKATFTVNGISISAVLYFNQKGQLVNFISHDRYAIADRKQYPFLTPVKDYKNYNGYNLASYGEAIWQYPEGEFSYAKYTLKDVKYNCK